MIIEAKNPCPRCNHRHQFTKDGPNCPHCNCPVRARGDGFSITKAKRIQALVYYRIEATYYGVDDKPL